jgi:hypothetical protein
MRVRLTGVDGTRVRAADEALALMSIPPLAAEDVPARFVEDRQLRRTLGTTVSTPSGAQALGLLPMFAMFADLTCSWHLEGARRVGSGSHSKPLDATRRAFVSGRSQRI